MEFKDLEKHILSAHKKDQDVKDECEDLICDSTHFEDRNDVLLNWSFPKKYL